MHSNGSDLQLRTSDEVENKVSDRLSGRVFWCRDLAKFSHLAPAVSCHTCNLLLLESLYSTYGPLRTRYLLTVETPTKTWSKTYAENLTQNLIECTQAAPERHVLPYLDVDLDLSIEVMVSCENI